MHLLTFPPSLLPCLSLLPSLPPSLPSPLSLLLPPSLSGLYNVYTCILGPCCRSNVRTGCIWVYIGPGNQVVLYMYMYHHVELHIIYMYMYKCTCMYMYMYILGPSIHCTGHSLHESSEQSHSQEALQSPSMSCPEFQDRHEACPDLLVMDLRSYTAALGNRAKGGGCECTGEYGMVSWLESGVSRCPD